MEDGSCLPKNYLFNLASIRPKSANRSHLQKFLNPSCPHQVRYQSIQICERVSCYCNYLLSTSGKMGNPNRKLNNGHLPSQYGGTYCFIMITNGFWNHRCWLGYEAPMVNKTKLETRVTLLFVQSWYLVSG